MPKMQRYGQDSELTANDKLLGQDSGGETKTFSLSSLTSHISAAVGTAGTYKHTQNSASTTWTVTHNLNKEDVLPHVTIKSDSGTFNNYEILGDIRYINQNQLTINYHTAQRGFAFVG